MPRWQAKGSRSYQAKWQFLKVLKGKALQEKRFHFLNEREVWRISFFQHLDKAIYSLKEIHSKRALYDSEKAQMVLLSTMLKLFLVAAAVAVMPCHVQQQDHREAES